MSEQATEGVRSAAAHRAARELEVRAYVLLADLTPEAIEEAAAVWHPNLTELIRRSRGTLLAAAEAHHLLDAHPGEACAPKVQG